MKPSSVHQVSIFPVQSAAKTPQATRRSPSVHLALDQVDYAETVIRAFLVLCVIISLVVCVWRTVIPAPDVRSQPASNRIASAASACGSVM